MIPDIWRARLEGNRLELGKNRVGREEQSCEGRIWEEMFLV